MHQHMEQPLTRAAAHPRDVPLRAQFSLDQPLRERERRFVVLRDDGRQRLESHEDALDRPLDHDLAVVSPPRIHLQDRAWRPLSRHLTVDLPDASGLRMIAHPHAAH